MWARKWRYEMGGSTLHVPTASSLPCTIPRFDRVLLADLVRCLRICIICRRRARGMRLVQRPTRITRRRQARNAGFDDRSLSGRAGKLARRSRRHDHSKPRHPARHEFRSTAGLTFLPAEEPAPPQRIKYPEATTLMLGVVAWSPCLKRQSM